MKALILLVLISSCDSPEYKKSLLQIDSASRRCTLDEFILMKQEFDVCKQTGYFTSYCYDLARVSYCSKRSNK